MGCVAVRHTGRGWEETAGTLQRKAHGATSFTAQHKRSRSNSGLCSKNRTRTLLRLRQKDASLPSSNASLAHRDMPSKKHFHLST